MSEKTLRYANSSSFPQQQQINHNNGELSGNSKRGYIQRIFKELKIPTEITPYHICTAITTQELIPSISTEDVIQGWKSKNTMQNHEVKKRSSIWQQQQIITIMIKIKQHTSEPSCDKNKWLPQQQLSFPSLVKPLFSSCMDLKRGENGWSRKINATHLQENKCNTSFVCQHYYDTRQLAVITAEQLEQWTRNNNQQQKYSQQQQ